MLRLWLVLATLAALALSVQVPAVDNDDWHVDGQRTVLPVEGCTQFRSALLLHQGSAAMYRFNGTSVAVLGAVYEDGAEALIEFEGQQRRVNAQSRQRKCAEFARFSNLNAGTLHTIRISVTGGGGRAVFPLIALDITPPAGSGPPPPGQPPSAPKPPDSPPNPAPPANPTTKPLPTRPVTPIPSGTDDDEDDKPTSSTTRKPDDQKPTGTPGKGVNSGNDEEGDDEGEDSNNDDQNATLTEQPSNTADGESRPPLTVDSDTITSSNDSPAPSGSPDSSLDNSNQSSPDASSDNSSGPKASTLIPAILIPILILLALGAFAIWFIRRRRRTRLPPSAEWRMANPNYEAGGGYGSTDQMSEVPPWNPPAPSGYGADGRPWSPFQDDGRRY